MLIAHLSEDVAYYLSQGHVNLAIAAEFEFNSGVSRVHSATGDIVIGGETFTGAGMLGDCSAISEENNTSDQDITLTLCGLDNNLINIALNEKVIGKRVTLYIVVFDDEYTALAYNVLYVGKISQTAMMAGSQGSIAYTAGNIFQEWSKGKPYRYTDESHAKMYPDDRIFRYGGQMSDRSIYWGSKKDAPGFTYS
ncbi:tail protein [Klebsiella phage VLCpiS6a]|nr:tail protein [Klebsiella phage VLCpiS6a]